MGTQLQDGNQTLHFPAEARLLDSQLGDTHKRALVCCLNSKAVTPGPWRARGSAGGEQGPQTAGLMEVWGSLAADYNEISVVGPGPSSLLGAFKITARLLSILPSPLHF